MASFGISSATAEEPTFSPADLEFFEKRVRPILAERCYECHALGTPGNVPGAGKEKGGLSLSNRPAILTGGDSGPAAIAGEPEKSLLVEAIRYDPAGFQMPPAGKLPQNQIDILTEWVKRGLPHPAAVEAKPTKQGVDLVAGRKHWAFQPLREQPLPDGADSALFPGQIDIFLEAKRREQGLQGSPAADSRTLLRRASFDLLGLPPSAAELVRWQAELAAAGPAADERYAAIIDQLLASPQYGERWGRYWLDLARYADVTESWREGEGQPWRYRDWVIRAWNADVPYDRFVQQQLAADLLPAADPRDNAALGFLGLSPTYWKELKLDHQVIKQVVAEEWEEKLDAIGSTFLGLTIGCARCHDHKFDPITTQDYYALAGVLASIREADRPLIPQQDAAPAIAARARAKTVEAKLKPLAAKKEPTAVEKTELEQLRNELMLLQTTPHFDLPIAAGIVDAALHVLPAGNSATKLEYRAGEAQDLAMHVRGNPARTGPVVPRRFLSVLAANPDQKFENGSGRLQLAQALVTDAGPLAARVIVNRVWKHHFGRGLVDTPSNFGVQGSPPSHRELLDDLAARFVAHEWSLKWLHREIMTSAGYRQSSRPDPARQAIDPDNRLLWRMMPRRLEVEAWRDALLLATEQLDFVRGGAPIELADLNNRRRTVYGIVKRREVSELLRLFDFPDPVAHAASREPTITPLQQLYYLNSPFFDRQSRALAAEALRTGRSNVDRIELVYMRLYQRSPTPAEKQLGTEFLDSFTTSDKTAEAWRQYLHVLLASNEFLFVD